MANFNNSKNVVNTKQAKIRNERISLINKIIIPRSNQVYAPKNIDLIDIYVAVSNVLENCLKEYLKAKARELDVKSMELFTLIQMAGKSDMPKKFNGFFSIMRIKSNKQRHDYVESLDDLGLLILRLEFYQFIDWFVVSYLKLPPIEVAENWYNQFTTNNKIGTTARVSVPSKTSVQNERIKKQDIAIQDELEYCKKQIEHKDKIITSLKMREAELMQKLINHKY